MKEYYINGVREAWERTAHSQWGGAELDVVHRNDLDAETEVLIRSIAALKRQREAKQAQLRADLEVGALRRARDTYRHAESKTDSTTYAGRAMIGWSWRFGQSVFVAAATGIAVGVESGTETIMDDAPSHSPVTESITRQKIEWESYLRIGLAFDFPR